MKLVFFGTPNFAIPTLNALHKSEHEVLAVITVPEKRSGRGLSKTISPVKQLAQTLNYTIHQPLDLNDPAFLSIMNMLNADIFVVVAYRILPEKLISIPRAGTVNLHASLLPKYRGAAPIQRAILNGENETGVTTFFIQKKVDTGDILLQEQYKLNSTITTGEAYHDLAILGSDLIIKTLNLLDRNKLTQTQQNNINATLAPKISSADCLIDWNKSALIIHNQIRGLSPHPGAYTSFKNKRVKLFNSQIKTIIPPAILRPGNIQYTKHSLQVGTGSEIIYIHEIQLEGRKRMTVSQFIAGFPQIKGDFFG